MKKLYLISLSLTSILGITSCDNETEANDNLIDNQNFQSNTETTPINPVTDDIDWNLIFEDNFEGSTNIPDPEKWILCKKGEDSWNRYLSESYDQAYQQDGYLYLIGERKDGEYLTGGIETRGKFDFTYGKVECRAKFERTPKGNHTGIWMMPSPPAEQWPKSGEIDIMEHLSDQNVIFQTAHSWYADDMGHKDDPIAQEKVTLEDKEGWNIYGLVWTPDSLDYYVNGELYLSYPNLHLEGENGDYQWPFDHPFYLILSQSLGGEGTWAGEIDNDELPAIFQIDWIKVWQPSDNAGIDRVIAD